jgi:hypothetical protein
MLTVEATLGEVETRLRASGVVCPDCSGVLHPWGFARVRWLRSADGRVRVRPRRAVCAGCGRTHVLLPVLALARRADTAAVIGAGLVAGAAGWGARRIAGVLGRPAATVRGWLRRFAAGAGALRRVFTGLLGELDADPPGLAPAGSVFADAVAAVLAVAAAVGRRWGTAVATLSAWEVAAALSNGRLLAPAPPAEWTNTSRLWWQPR